MINHHAVAELAASRDRIRRNDEQNGKALLAAVTRRCNERAKTGSPDAYAELAETLKTLRGPLHYNESSEHIASLQGCMRKGKTECDRAMKAIQTGGAKVWDETVTPTGRPRSVDVGIKLREAQNLFSMLDTALGMPGSHLGDAWVAMATLGKWFEDHSTELGAAIDARGHEAPPLASLTLARTNPTADIAPSPSAAQGNQRPLKACVRKAGLAMERLGEDRRELLPEAGKAPSERAWQWARDHFYPRGQCPQYLTFCRYVRAYYQDAEPKTRRPGERVPVSGSMIRASDRPRR